MKTVHGAGVLLVVLGALCVARPVSAYTVGHSGLRVFPYEGRPGSTLYVSGYGLNPNTQLYILFACPNYQEAKQENVRIIGPPSSLIRALLQPLPAITWRQ